MLLQEPGGNSSYCLLVQSQIGMVEDCRFRDTPRRLPLETFFSLLKKMANEGMALSIITWWSWLSLLLLETKVSPLNIFTRQHLLDKSAPPVGNLLGQVLVWLEDLEPMQKGCSVTPRVFHGNLQDVLSILQNDRQLEYALSLQNNQQMWKPCRQSWIYFCMRPFEKHYKKIGRTLWMFLDFSRLQACVSALVTEQKQVCCHALALQEKRCKLAISCTLPYLCVCGERQAIVW